MITKNCLLQGRPWTLVLPTTVREGHSLRNFSTVREGHFLDHYKKRVSFRGSPEGTIFEVHLRRNPSWGLSWIKYITRGLVGLRWEFFFVCERLILFLSLFSSLYFCSMVIIGLVFFINQKRLGGIPYY